MSSTSLTRSRFRNSIEIQIIPHVRAWYINRNLPMIPNPRLMSSLSFSRWFLPQTAIKSKKHSQRKGPKERNHNTCLNLKLIVVLTLKGPTELCWTKTIQPSPIHFPLVPPRCSDLVAGRSSIIASKLSIEIVDHRLVPESLPCVFSQVPMTKQHSKLLEIHLMTFPRAKGWRSSDL